MPIAVLLTKRALCAAVALSAAGVSLSAHASMGNIGTTYGLLPSDIGTAQALSMFNTQVSATYYNPAYLAKDPRGELTTGLLHAAQELRATGADRTGRVLSNTPSQHVLIGMKTDLSSLTRFGPPLYLGFVAGVEKYGMELLAFESETSESGQFLHYGRQPLFLNIGGATTLWRGIDAGVSTRITLHSEADLSTTTDLAGNTEQEQLSVQAKPSIRGIASINVDFGKTFCPQGCWLSGFETAVAYRMASNTKTTVSANTVIPGLIPEEEPLNFTIVTYDSYQPSVIALGMHYGTERWRVGVTVEQQNWSELEDELAKDTVKDQANAQFRDIIVPRIGGSFQLTRHFAISAGLAWQESALKSDSTTDVNYFDNEKYIAGLGLTAEFPRTRYLTYPVRIDLGYQRQMLKERDFIIDNSNPDSTNSGTVVTTDGDIDVFSGSISFKF
ncbi:MAG: outer membrane protein transport protein [Marinobacter sp.]|nr:outer membrane protein transport protein [Marinobacter sp.]